MKRRDFLDLASSGLRMPIGTDLVLHERADAQQISFSPRLLGQVVEDAARRYQTPLAVPLMDLRLEKADLLGMLGVAEADVERVHFPTAPSEDDIDLVASAATRPFPARHQAHLGAIRYIRQETDLVPVGMAIGPFSLMTKLMADPITPIAMIGMGATAAEDEEVRGVERCLRLAELAVRRSVRAQVEAGAATMLICEPAANVVYLSPRQISAGSNAFERLVMQPNLRLKQQLADAGVSLIFHDCGQLDDFMVQQFAERLDPAVLSLGSSQKLWESAAVVPKRVVLFGNLPTKTFYSDSAMPVEKVEQLTLELIARMALAGHPHIPGSECDVLHVPEAAATIRRKVEVMLTCGRSRYAA